MPLGSLVPETCVLLRHMQAFDRSSHLVGFGDAVNLLKDRNPWRFFPLAQFRLCGYSWLTSQLRQKFGLIEQACSRENGLDWACVTQLQCTFLSLLIMIHSFPKKARAWSRLGCPSTQTNYSATYHCLPPDTAIIGPQFNRTREMPLMPW